MKVRYHLLPFACVVVGSCAPIPRPNPPAVPPPPAAPAAPIVRAPEPVRQGGFAFQGALVQGGMAIGTSPAGAVSVSLDGAALPLTADGRFLIAFGRDHGPAASLAARLANGGVVRETLAITARTWDIQSLPTLPKGTTPTPAFLARRKIELAQINAARARSVTSDGWRQRFQWPVVGRISGVFGSQRIYAGEPGSPHSGVDVAGPAGTPIVVPADGVVVLAAAAPFTLEGNLLMVDHGMGLGSAFLHLSRIDVKVGDRVVRGQRIGAIGMTGRATGPHLHWAMKWRDQRIDPQLVAGPMPAG